MPFFRRDTKVVTVYAVALPSTSSPDTTITIIRTISITSSDADVTTTIPLTVTTPISTSSVPTSTLTIAVSTASAATSTSDASTTTSTSTSTAPVLSLFGDSLGSTKLGLAVGIPIAIVSLFAIIILVWYFLRKKVNKKSSEFLTFTQYGAEEDPKKSSFYPNESPAPLAKPGFFNRLSKMVNFSEWPTLEFKSPMLLRRFHLTNEQKEQVEKNLPNVPINPYSNSSSLADMENATDAFPTKDKLYTVVKPYARRLADELTVCVGEKVILKKVHPDGWALVTVVDGKDEGVVPMMCLKKT